MYGIICHCWVHGTHNVYLHSHQILCFHVVSYLVFSDDPILSRDLPYGFVLTTSKEPIKFGCKTYNERETWVNGLFRVTGQSNKPSDEQDGFHK